MPKQHFNRLFFSSGDKVLILVKSRGPICPIVITFLDLIPWIWEVWYIKILILHFTNYLDINVYVWKLFEQHFNAWMFSNPGDKILFMLNFCEVRISEWIVTLCRVTLFRVTLFRVTLFRVTLSRVTLSRVTLCRVRYVLLTSSCNTTAHPGLGRERPRCELHFRGGRGLQVPQQTRPRPHL